MRNISFILFFFVLVSIYIGLHYYNAYFYWRYFGFNFKNTRLFFIFIAFLSILALFLKRKYMGIYIDYFSLISYVWMGTIFLFSFYFLLCDIFIFLFGKHKVFPLIFLIFGIVSILFSIYKAVSMPNVKELEFKSNMVKKNIKIAMISDMHIDFKFKKELFLKIINEVGNKKPDLIVFLGDLLDPGFKMNDEEFLLLNKISIPLIGVLGNHEYYYGVNNSENIYQRLGVKLLRNTSFLYGDVNFIGFVDIKTENISIEEIISILKKNYQRNKLNIILSHQPLYFDKLAEDFEFIMLSSHIHKGQIFPFNFFVRLIYKYFYGVYKIKNSILYVTSGTSTWGPPMRFGADSELVFLTITNKFN